MPYLTGNVSAAVDFVCRRVLIPNDLALIMAVNGALLELTKTRNWEQEGSATPDEVAALMQTMFFDYLDSRCDMRIGDIVMNISDEVPEGYLRCDGSLYDGVDYPELYAVIWIGWKRSGGQFQVPDMRQRSPVGTGDTSEFTVRGHGELFGAEAHMLGYTELFPHNHADEQSNDITIKVPAAGTDTVVAGPTFGTATGITPIFDQTAFPTVPPSTALPFYVVAR